LPAGKPGYFCAACNPPGRDFVHILLGATGLAVFDVPPIQDEDLLASEP
jgi:hypothetical protein